MEYRVTRYSRLIDDDFYEELENDKKKATSDRKSAKENYGLLGGVVGGALGAHQGKGKIAHTLVGAGLGAYVGSTLGYAGMKNREKHIHQRIANLKKQYEGAKDEEDRRYLREKYIRLSERDHRDAQNTKTREAIWLTHIR